MLKSSIVDLASSSPRRLELLKQVGLEAKIIVPNVSEIQNPNESPYNFAKRMSEMKANSVWSQIQDKIDLPLIAADTIVVCDDLILGKPNSKEECIRTLTRLSGRTHKVITAVVIINSVKMKQCVVETDVTFGQLTASQIESYWESGEPCDKAGCYAIQGKAATSISHLNGSYSNVMGLPLFETVNLLNDFGITVI